MLLLACNPLAVCSQSYLGERRRVPATKVLLVEDEYLIRMMVAEFLQDEGFEVIEAWDGDEAARLLDGACGFDVLFTDVRMPGTMDGIDVAMHARRRYPMIPLLVVSGYAVQLAVRLGLLDPAATFLGKPYNLKVVLETLRRLTATS